MKKELRIIPAVVCLLIYSSINPVFSQETYNFELMWGSYGIEDGQFSSLTGVAIDSSGNVYVADKGNHRIQKFDSNGNFITKWGSEGVGDGQFKDLYGVTVDPNGNVYVSDHVPLTNGRIQKFDSGGNFISKLSFAATPAEFPQLPYFFIPCGVATDLAGSVYAVVYEASTVPIATPPAPVPFIFKFDSSGNFITKWGGSGTGDGQFGGIGEVAVDPAGYVYVADTGNHRIQKFDSTGNFITQWGLPDKYRGCMVPSGVATDLFGNVFVSNVIGCLGIIDPPFPTTPNIMKFDSTGTFITGWISGSPSWECIYGHPQGVAADPFRNVYVADPCENCIQKFSPILLSIALVSPSINEFFSACSLNSPLTFSWDVSETFDDYKVQFSADTNFASIFSELSVQSPATQIAIPSNTWQEIMLIPGASGGTVYWRVIGTKPDGTTTTSAVRTFFVGAEPAGNPNISPTKKRSRPTLTWQNNCNTSFKVVLGSDSSFSKKTYAFEIGNSTGDEGTFSKALTPLEWLRIKMLVRNKTGAPIYWFVESWDGLGRYSKSNVMDFVLGD